VVRKLWRGTIVCFELTFERVGRDGEGIDYVIVFAKILYMIPDLRSSRGKSTTSKIPWALGRETDWRNVANDWVDGKI